MNSDAAHARYVARNHTLRCVLRYHAALCAPIPTQEFHASFDDGRKHLMTAARRGNPPEEEGGEIANLPDEDMPSTCRTILGSLMAFVWLAGLSEAAYYAVVLVCTYVTGFNELTVGTVILAFGAQIPDAIASVSLAKSGHFDGAISSCVSSQVIVVSVGLGLPWTAVSISGSSIELSTTSASNYLNEILVGIVFVNAIVYLVTTVCSVPTTGKAKITRSGATITIFIFAVGYAAFLVLEILRAMDIVLYDDDA